MLLGISVAAMPSCAAPRAAAPREGVIMYHEPVAQVGIMKTKARPVKQVFVTAGEELAEEHAFQSFSGTVEGVDERGSVSQREWNKAVQKMLEKSQAGTTRVLKPEAFMDLWARLEDAGIFTLPLRAGKDRPTQEPYFLLKSGPETWVFARPALQAARADDPGVAHMRAWQKAKLAFFDFVNER